jgi:signal transduction histidine kinase
VYEELEVERLKSQYQKNFFAMLTHELRNPLYGILGILETFNRGVVPPNLKNLAELGSNTGQLMMSLINDILDLSQIETNKFKLSINKFSPEEAVNQCVETLRFQFEKKGLRLNYEYNKECLER